MIIIPGYYETHIGSNRFFVKLSNKLRKNYKVLRYDYIGFGNSVGEEKDITVTNMLKSLEVIYNYIFNKKVEKVYLIGHSYGFPIAVLFYNKLDKRNNKVKKIIGLMGSCLEFNDYFAKNEILEIEKNGYIGYDTFRVHKNFIEDSKRYSVKEVIKSIDIPILNIFGRYDNIVLPSEEMYCKELNPKVKTMALELDHFFNGKDQNKIIGIIEEFLLEEF